MSDTVVHVGVVGAGGISNGVHLPGLSLSKQARVVALCDPHTPAVTALADRFAIPHRYSDYREMLALSDLDAVVIATPNYLHSPIAHAALAAGKHVLCEKPIGLSAPEALEMAQAAEKSGKIAMTAFTYRYVPAMQYMKHLIDTGYVGQPRHVRAVRFQDWGTMDIGWRQVKAQAGSGEIGDMGAHRIDYAQHLVGPIARVVGRTRLFVPERSTADGTPTIADVDDWVGFLAEFSNGVTGVFEMSKLATGRRESGVGLDQAEVNGTEGSLIYQLHRPYEIQMAQGNETLTYQQVPDEFLRVPGATHDPHQGDPSQVFRYNQAATFIRTIVTGQPSSPAFASFRDGARCQAVVDAIIQSSAEERWIPIPVV